MSNVAVAYSDFGGSSRIELEIGGKTRGLRRGPGFEGPFSMGLRPNTPSPIKPLQVMVSAASTGNYGSAAPPLSSAPPPPPPPSSLSK